MIPPKLNYKRIIIICACIFAFGILFGFIAFPKLLTSGIKKGSALKPDSQIRNMWSDIPFALDFRVYLFNVTNPEAVMTGEKPHLQEVGPYYFEEYKKKINFKDFDDNDTVEFNAVDTFYFKPEKSGGLTGDEEIYFPNLLLLGMGVLIARDRQPMLPLINAAIKLIFHDPTSVFMKVKVMDLLYRGVDIDCSSDEFEATAICSAFDDADQLKKIDDDPLTYSFSMFASKNGTPSLKYTVSRGMKNYKDIARVLRWNDEDELDVFDEDHCNQFHGTEGTAFPPLLEKGATVWAFSPDLCRSLPTSYVEESKYAGIPTSLYTLIFEDMAKNEEMHCFCRDPPEGCPPAGMIDLTTCVEGPLLASMPHFYGVSDPKVLNGVTGLQPDKKKHRLEIQFERNTGSPISAAKRLQFSMDIVPVPEIDSMANIPEMVLPLFWVEEAAHLNTTFTNVIKKQLLLVKKVNKIIRWLCVVLGAIGIGVSVFFMMKLSKEGSITPVKSNSAKSEKADVNPTSTEEKPSVEDITDRF